MADNFPGRANSDDTESCPFVSSPDVFSLDKKISDSIIQGQVNLDGHVKFYKTRRTKLGEYPSGVDTTLTTRTTRMGY